MDAGITVRYWDTAANRCLNALNVGRWMLGPLHQSEQAPERRVSMP